jgi:hypothetical protein
MAEWTPEELEDTRHDLPGYVTTDVVEELVGLGAEITFSNEDDEDEDLPPDTMFVHFTDAVENPADVYRVLLLSGLHADEVSEEDEFGDVLRFWWD